MDKTQSETETTYRFGDFIFDAPRARLLKAGREVRLRPKVFDTLGHFLANPGRLITKEELLQVLWPGSFVTDDSLVQCLVELRRALDDREQEILQTIPRRGYLFTAKVTAESPQAGPETVPLPRSEWPIRQRLPAPRTPLIGRERELAAVKALLLDPAVRMVTLTGSGGSGKTRLGLEAALQLADRFPGGAWFAGLGSISDPDMVPASIAEPLGVGETGGRSLLDSIRIFLRDRDPSPVLIILDNFEHVLAASPVVVDLLDAAGNVKILVTSRTPLRVYGEFEFGVPPLDLPDPGQPLNQLLANPAVTLFANRAAAVRPGFHLTSGNISLVAEICSRVDGLPLAIELAAARVKLLPLAAIVLRLQSRLELLTTGARDLPARQQTLRKTIDWSYDLLNESEQRLLCRLSVFSGGWTLESAEAVANVREDIGADVLGLMSSLLDKSLIQQIDLPGNDGRFRMLETIREYSLERLAGAQEEEATRQAHAAYCLILAEEGNPDLSDEARTSWLSLCDAEHDNLSAALDWLFRARRVDWALRFCLALFRYWDTREHLSEGRSRLETILHLAGNGFSRERANVTHCLGAFATAQGDFPAAAHWLEQGLLIYRALNDASGIAVSLNALGISARDRGDYAAAQTSLEESLTWFRKASDRRGFARCLHNLSNVAGIRGDHDGARAGLLEAIGICEELGDRGGAAWALNHLGDIAREQSNLREAREHFSRALAIFRESGNRWGVARSLADLASIACHEGDYPAAVAMYRESIEVFASLGHRRGVARCLEGFAILALAQGAARDALVMAGASARIRKSIGTPLPPAEQTKLEEELQPAWQSLSDPEGNHAWAEGWELTMERAIRFATGGPPTLTAASPDR